MAANPKIADVLAASKFNRRSGDDYKLIGKDLADWLAAKRSPENGTTLPDAEIDFGDRPVPRVTAKDIHLAWLACPEDPACDSLARLALDVVEHRGAVEDVLRASLAFNVKQDREKGARRSQDMTSHTLGQNGPDITEDAAYRRDVLAYLKRIGKLRPGGTE